MSARRLILGLATWLVVVAASSAVAWAVISHAGDGLVSTDQPLAVDTTNDGRPTSTGTAGPGGPSATSTAAPEQPDAEAPTPTGPAPTSTSSSSTPSSAPASPTRSTAPARQPQRRTWQGTGGGLVVECDGARISLVAAQPDAGFKVDVGREGQVGLEVEFEGREDEDGHGSHLTATCVSGVPEFDVETRGAEDERD